MAYQSFEELEVWRKARKLAVRVYEVLQECKDRGLKDQMTRSAVSIASNIAEGSERATKTEFIRFLNIAKGSAAELRTQTYIAAEIGILTSRQEMELLGDLKHLSAMLHALAKSLS